MEKKFDRKQAWKEACHNPKVIQNIYDAECNLRDEIDVAKKELDKAFLLCMTSGKKPPQSAITTTN